MYIVHMQHCAPTSLKGNTNTRDDTSARTRLQLNKIYGTTSTAWLLAVFLLCDPKWVTLQPVCFKHKFCKI